MTGREQAVAILETLAARITEDLQTGVRRTSLAYVKAEIEKAASIIKAD